MKRTYTFIAMLINDDRVNKLALGNGMKSTCIIIYGLPDRRKQAGENLFSVFVVFGGGGGGGGESYRLLK